MGFPNLTCIEHLLRIYWSPLEHPDAWMVQGGNVDAHARSVRWLIENDMIEPRSPCCDQDRASCYEVTARGRAYIEHLRSLPLPVAETCWSMPK